ncbi:MAG: gfo/Idh/MocA family oxidoreductase [Candidatus Electrothrix sp. AX2]|nr:gfo/Idh/MocA family oxidoreductase [Candidatus Electrothrix gigas]
MEKFRWGIFGSGVVASKFVLGLNATVTPNAVTRVASRTLSNAEAFAGEIGAKASSYAELVSSGDIDAVYIATPPVVHEEHALMCLKERIPVIIEKPFTIDVASCERIISSAGKAGVFVMEAMWTRFLPLVVDIKKRIADGELGKVLGFSGSFCQPNKISSKDSNFNAALGGGALMHRGVYPLSLACYFLGPVAEISSQFRLGKTGVDEHVMAVARHKNGALSHLEAGLTHAAPNNFTVTGSKGTIVTEAPIYRPFAMYPRQYLPQSKNFTRSTGCKKYIFKESGLVQSLYQQVIPLSRSMRSPFKCIRKKYSGNGYGHEADAAMQSIRSGLKEHPLMPLTDSLHVMKIIDQLRSQFNESK